MKKFFYAFTVLTLLASCSSSTDDKGPKEGAIELFVHGEKEKDGTTTITKVFEEIDGDKRIIRIQRIHKGRIEETIHHLDSPSFVIKIPVSDRPDVVYSSGSGGSEKQVTSDVLVYTQQLEIAREKVIKANYGEALVALEKAERVSPKSARVHMMKGSVYYAQGDIEKAKKSYQEALKYEPENKEILQFLDYLKVRDDSQKSQYKVK